MTVHLTTEEREGVLSAAHDDLRRPYPQTALTAAVEAIVAARMSALTVERDGLAAQVEAVRTHPVVVEVAEERTRQTEKHGDQAHLPDGTGPYVLGDLVADGRHRYATGLARWAKARTDAASHSQGDGSVTFEHILTEEWAEALAEDDPALLRAELVQVAAVAVQWIEAIDLRAVLAAAVSDPTTESEESA